MNIREYTESDELPVVSLWQECGLVVPQNDPARDIARKLLVGRDLFLVGVGDSGLVGTVMGGYDGHRGWINYLAVKPSVRGSGYGRQLMREVEELLRLRGCAKINLQVRATNDGVIAFYKTLGYGNDNVVGLGKRLTYDND